MSPEAGKGVNFLPRFQKNCFGSIFRGFTPYGDWQNPNKFSLHSPRKNWDRPIWPKPVNTSKLTKCKSNQILGLKQYFLSYGFLLFQHLVIFLFIWFSIYSILWIWSTGSARKNSSRSTRFFQLLQSHKAKNYNLTTTLNPLQWGSISHATYGLNKKVCHSSHDLNNRPFG